MFINKKISISISRKILAFSSVVLAIAFLTFYYLVSRSFAQLNPAPVNPGAGTIIALFFVYAFTMFALYTLTKKILRRKIGEPLNKMAELTGEIVKGNYNIHFAIEAENELGNLAKNLNFMSEVIAQHTNILEKKITSQDSVICKISNECDQMNVKVKEYESYPVFFNECFSGELFLAFDYLLEYSKHLKLSLNKIPDEHLKTEFCDFIKNMDYICSNGIKLAGMIEAKALENAMNCFKINKSELTLNDILYHKVKFLNPLINFKKIKISNEIDKNAFKISADPQKFNYIFGRILFIAIKYCLKNGKILIKSSIEGSTAAFDISALKKIEPENDPALKKPLCDNLSDDKVSDEMNNGSFVGDAPEPVEAEIVKDLGIAPLFVELHGGNLNFEIPDDKNSNLIIKFHFKISQLK